MVNWYARNVKREKKKEHLITLMDVELLQVSTPSSNTTYGIIPNNRAIFQMKSLQILAASADFR